MNEWDGNFTLWNEGGRVEWGWNKIRGPEFDTRYFYIDKLGSPDILDSKGRTPLLPVMRPMSTADVERCEDADHNLSRRLLRAMLDNPDDTQAAWGEAIGRDKSRVNRKLQKLKELKLVEQRLGRWRLTPKGYEEASNA
jgi:hypothetical protein